MKGVLCRQIKFVILGLSVNHFIGFENLVNSHVVGPMVHQHLVIHGADHVKTALLNRSVARVVDKVLHYCAARSINHTSG